MKNWPQAKTKSQTDAFTLYLIRSHGYLTRSPIYFSWSLGLLADGFFLINILHKFNTIIVTN